MSVGALWYAEQMKTIDPSLFAAIPLVEAGFPFLKRGLMTKHARIYPKDTLHALLVDQGHPVEGIDSLPEPIVSLIACQADNRIAPLSFAKA